MAGGNLDWTPLQAPALQRAQNTHDMNAMMTEMAALGLHKVTSRPDIATQDADEFLRGYGRSWYKDQGKGTYDNYEDFVADNPLLQLAETGTKMRYDSSGKLEYLKDDKWSADLSDITGGQSNQLYGTATGEELFSPFGMRTDTGASGTGDASVFESDLDRAWRLGMKGPEGLQYKAPRSMLGALLHRDTYRPTGGTYQTDEGTVSRKLPGQNILQQVGAGVSNVASNVYQKGAGLVIGVGDELKEAGSQLTGAIGGVINRQPQKDEVANYSVGSDGIVTAINKPDEYIMQQGDTLDAIGRKWGVNWPQILEWNNLTEEDAYKLPVGYKLKLTPPSSGEGSDQSGTLASDDMANETDPAISGNYSPKWYESAYGVAEEDKWMGPYGGGK